MKRTTFFLLFIASAFIILLVFWIRYLNHNIETKNMDDAARKNASGKFILLSGGITHYEEAGTDSAVPVVLIHGFSVPYYIWDNVFDSLAAKNFHVIRYDEFGRGYSDRPAVKYSPEFYRQQLFDLIKTLKVKLPVSLAGVSFGAAVASDFAVHHPEMVNKIILIDPVYHFKPFASSEWIAEYEMALAHEKNAQSQLNDFKHPLNFPHWVERYKPQMEFKGFRHALVSTSFNYTGKYIMDNYRSLDSLHKNIMLIWGKEDHTVPFEFSDSLQKLLHVQFLAVEDAAHLPYLEQPEIVLPKMISFLQQ